MCVLRLLDEEVEKRVLVVIGEGGRRGGGDYHRSKFKYMTFSRFFASLAHVCSLGHVSVSIQAAAASGFATFVILCKTHDWKQQTENQINNYNSHDEKNHHHHNYKARKPINIPPHVFIMFLRQTCCPPEGRVEVVPVWVKWRRPDHWAEVGGVWRRVIDAP